MAMRAAVARLNEGGLRLDGPGLRSEADVQAHAAESGARR